MSEPTKIKWRIAGEEVVSCNCSWGCPCQFNALPTTGQCEAIGAWQINEGYFGNTRLDGVRFAGVVWWPGPIHEGNGILRVINDQQSTDIADRTIRHRPARRQAVAQARGPRAAAPAWRDLIYRYLGSTE
jgi:hypothetical protein